jgi:hypothetical protein
MVNQFDPIVDQWYSYKGSQRDKGEMFRVVAIDADADAIEIQTFDGDIEELDSEAWRDLDTEPAEAPENWTGPFDDIEADDLGDTENAASGVPLEPLQADEDWQNSRTPDAEEYPGETPLEEVQSAPKKVH